MSLQMNPLLEVRRSENGELHSLNEASNGNIVEQMKSYKNLVGGDQQVYLVEWLNSMFPYLCLTLDASEEELRVCLGDGAVLCNVLNRLSPGSVEMGGRFDQFSEPSINVKRFLEATARMGLPGFEISDLEQGSMVPVLDCLHAIKAHFTSNIHGENNQNHSRRRWNPSDVNPLEGSNCTQAAIHEGERQKNTMDMNFQSTLHHSAISKQGSYADLPAAKILDIMKSNNLENASTKSLFDLANEIFDESLPHRVGSLLLKVVQEIERRFSNQAENFMMQNNLLKARNKKFQSRLRVLETLAKGTKEENEVPLILVNQLQQMKIEKKKIEEKKKSEDQELARLLKENDCAHTQILALKEEAEMARRSHEKHCLQLESEALEARVDLEKRLKDLESLLTDSRKRVKELESFSESKSHRWRKKELSYKRFIDFQSRALRDLRKASESIKQDVVKTQRRYHEEFNYLGTTLRGLASAAQNYHSVLEENRKLYNEVQDLKGTLLISHHSIALLSKVALLAHLIIPILGNIRVYCRIRPFLSGQSSKQTTIEYIGENGELVVVNPLKQGKESRRMFKFNKVFNPAATQEEVFADTQPLIRSVLDGYNVCIFAYGQTGSGKTYTMTGPNASSKEDWGVNYRALNDLFQISQSRKSSIAYEVGVQMVEIYNEQVRDLLSNAVPDASMHSVRSTEDVLELMNIGLMNRAVGATALNERSSRSHSILTVHVRGVDLETDAVLRGSLHLVDLAGSERVDRSEATGDRLREAQHINKSLSALGDVIFALAQKSPHVPYRNSKLTQVLQSSLGGQAKTLMFVQLNPDLDSYSETVSTLKFAERVSGVELGAARSNKEGKDVRELMEQLAAAKDSLAKKDEEIERLLIKVNANSEKHGLNPLRFGSSSPRRHSMGTPRGHSFSARKGAALIGKAASDPDNCSDFSDKHSEAGSARSMDDFRHHREFFQPLKSTAGDVAQNLDDDIDLLGFANNDSEERLSDISDSGLSMGTETDGSLCSAMDFALLPDVPKPPPPPPLPVEIPEKSSVPASLPSKLPRPPQKQVQPRPSRLSLSKSSSRVSSSTKKSISGSSSATKPAKRWQ
ncbi:Calponin homology domain [Dillenia turbinata]|uniref:Calponin homology domain n=1 Tax=Dillenia turbinata TaxID=194707 RepID=A0AAN8VSS4_9MAGN